MENNITARVQLVPRPGAEPVALVWIKRTYHITADGALAPGDPEPLRGDPLAGGQEPRITARPMDLWPTKQAPDLIVQGSAFAPVGRPTRRMEVSVRAGDTLKRIAVFGRRVVTWRAPGRVAISEPEPLCELPVTWDNAYGGIDWRAPVPAARSALEALRLESDHPGMYPRNPHGKGYLVCPEEVPGFEMPGLEDPDHLLTPETLISGAPERWYHQPLPACFDALPPVAFPRALFFADGCDAWHPGPEDRRLPEVARGILPEGYRGLMSARPLEFGPHPRFFQEAAPGLTLPGLGAGHPVEIRGMHPAGRRLRFTLPGAPAARLQEAGHRHPLTPRLHTVLCRPSWEQVSVLHGATCRLRRRYLPGTHRHIPVSVELEGGPTIQYRAPEPAHDRLSRTLEEVSHG